MKFEWWYDGYNFKLEAKELTRKELEKIMDFLEEMEK